MLQQYEQLVQSLERVVQPEEGLHPALRSQEGHEPPLKIILQNLYRYLMAVTANLDKLHEGVADARQAFLDKRKQVGAWFATLHARDLAFAHGACCPWANTVCFLQSGSFDIMSGCCLVSRKLQWPPRIQSVLLSQPCLLAAVHLSTSSCWQMPGVELRHWRLSDWPLHLEELICSMSK